MRSIVPVLAAAGLMALARPAAGQPTVQTNLDPAAQIALQAALGLTQAQLEQLIDDELRALYGLVDVPTFLRLSANAQSMANKGLGVDYATDFEDWLFGASVSVAADAGDADLDEVRALADGDAERAVPVSAGAQISVFLGYATEDWRFYVSGLYYPLNPDELEGTFYNAGVHVQYEAIGGVGRASLVRWGGLRLSSGFQFSRMLLELTDTYEVSGTLAQGLDLDTASVGTLELEQRAITIPLEATTHATFLYFLTLYAGVGIDFQFGDASMNLDVDTDLSTAGPSGGALPLGTARIIADELGDPDRIMVRFLGGVQLNIWRLKIFGQLNFLTSDLTLGLAAGLRLVI